MLRVNSATKNLLFRGYKTQSRSFTEFILSFAEGFRMTVLLWRDLG